MRLRPLALVLPLVVFVSWLASCSQESTDQSLGDVARETRRQKPQAPGSDSDRKTRVQELVASTLTTSNRDDYKAEIEEVLNREDFDKLDRAADSVRSSRARFPGGVWKLYIFYEAITQLPPGAFGEAAWNNRIQILERWRKQSPKSITAAPALAGAYMNWAEAARGTDWASNVSQQGWQSMAKRVQQAKAVLDESTHLPARCPYWYELMQQIALMQGWDRQKTRALFEEAVAFEPEFYPYYREYANYLLPRWYGDEGEVQAFANDVLKKVGGKYGEFLYFQIATVANCHCDNEVVNLGTMSWPKIKDGYAAANELYGGQSELQMNRFAYLTCRLRDLPAARDVFDSLGDSWDERTWGSKRNFDQCKNWALQPSPRRQ